jgi:hypothetical protein|nr:MAG TPA: hypothetical protein [Caudoviricetes sp.]
MRNKFIDLVQNKVTLRTDNPLGNPYPQFDPIVTTYNNFWGLATDTHCSYVNDRYIVTGSWLANAPGRNFNPLLDNLIWSVLVNGVDIRSSRFSCLGDFLNARNLSTKMISYNGSTAMEFVPKVPQDYEEKVPEVAYENFRAFETKISRLENVPGSFEDIYKQHNNTFELVEALNDSNKIKGSWQCLNRQLCCKLNGNIYTINLNENLDDLTIEKLFGTLQESITKGWRDHLMTNKYSKHEALDDFYKEMPELVDRLIEAYQASHDIVEDYENILDKGLDTIDFLKKLKHICNSGRKLLDSPSLTSLLDDILSQIDSTIYKVSKLS